MTKEAEYLDPKELKKGDLFRGMNWKKGGKNHIFKENTTLDNGDVFVVSMCNYWFYTYSIREPKEDTPENLCYWCSRRLHK